MARVRIAAPTSMSTQLDDVMTMPHRATQVSETDDGITVVSDDGVYHRRWQDDVRTLLR